jgi:hypothetical protein
MQLADRREHLKKACLIAGSALATGVPVHSEVKMAPAALGGGQLTSEGLDPAQDVIHPASLVGEWQCQRVVTMVEGDAGQAVTVWKALGGLSDEVFAGKKVESFATRFIAAPPNIKADYVFEGEALRGVVLDCAFETERRTRGAAVSWDAAVPGRLSFERTSGGGAVEQRVAQRRVELPSERGWGGSELLSVTTPAGGLLGDSGTVQRAALVQRRFRRALDGAALNPQRAQRAQTLSE